MDKLQINNLKDLKLFLGYYVREQDKLSIKEKIQLLEFIKESNMKQALFLLFKGRMVTQENEQLNEISVGQGFGQVVIKLTQGEATVAGTVAAAAIIYMASTLIAKGIVSTIVNKKCRVYKLGSPQYKKCINTLKIEKLVKTNTLLKNKISLCKNSKDPQLCKRKVEERIRKNGFKMDKIKYRIKELESMIKR